MDIEVLNSFSCISLDAIQRVNLLDRNETKYWFHISELNDILLAVFNDYKLLSVENGVVQSYITNYFDTEGNDMYLQHHNQKLHRFKIRKRQYVGSNISFLEIKNKSNKGRTYKSRIGSEMDITNFLKKEQKFIEDNTPFLAKELCPTLLNKFKRLTLVGNNFKERCTIDFDLEFESQNKIKSLDNIVVLEVKTDGRKQPSVLKNIMLDKRIKSSAFSKYCIGRCLSSDILKQNRFKVVLNSINKLNSHIN